MARPGGTHSEPVTLRDLAAALSAQEGELIAICMRLGFVPARNLRDFGSDYALSAEQQKQIEEEFRRANSGTEESTHKKDPESGMGPTPTSNARPTPEVRTWRERIGRIARKATVQIVVAIVAAAAIGIARGFLKRERPSAPHLESIDPLGAPVGSKAIEMILHGFRFDTSSIVRWDGVQRPTVFIHPAQLRLHVPARDLVAADTVNVTVYTPGGGESAPIAFVVIRHNPVPSIAAVVRHLGDTVWVDGTDFVERSVVELNGQSLRTTFLSSKRLLVSIKERQIATGQLTVKNPAPGGGDSKAFPTTASTATAALRRRLSKDGNQEHGTPADGRGSTSGAPPGEPIRLVDVTLEIPSRCSRGIVSVDEKQVEIVRGDNSEIVIRVIPSELVRTIRVVSGTRVCSIQAIITQAKTLQPR